MTIEGTTKPRSSPQDSTSGKVLRRSVPGWSVAGPVLLAGVVTATVVAAMVWHNNNFRKGIFGRFQHYQLASAQSKATMIESAFGEVSKGLSTLNASPAPATISSLTTVVEGFYDNHKDILDGIVLRDASGKLLLLCGRQEAFASETSSSAAPTEDTASDSDGVGVGRGQAVVYILLPHWKVDGAEYVLQAAVSVRKLCAKSLSSNVALQQSFLGLIDRRGDFIYKMDLGNASLLRGSHRYQGQSHITQADAVTEAMRSIFPRETGVTELATSGTDALGILVAFASVRLGQNRYSLVLGTSGSEISVPITAYERLTFTLIAALAVLFFAAGYLAYRSAQGNAQMEHRAPSGGRVGQRDEEPVPRPHEPRDPHTDERHPGHDGTGPGHRADGRKQRRYLTLAKQSADNLLTIINDILDLSKIEAGKLELSCETFSLRDCVDDSLGILAVQAANKGLDTVVGGRPDRAGPPGGRPRPAAASADEPGRQRGEVHAQGSVQR